jgi:hypothetical protein
MKLALTSLLCATIAFGGSNPHLTPTFSGPSNGQADVGLTPLQILDGPTTHGYFDIYFGDVTESITFDPIAQTLSTAGYVAVTPSRGTFEIKEDESDTVLGTVTLMIGEVSLDITYTHAGGGDYYGDLLIPVSATGTYLGQQFSATWNEVLPLAIWVRSSTSDTVTFEQETDWDTSPIDQSMIVGDIVVPQLGLTDGAEIENLIWYEFNTGLVTARTQPSRTRLADFR